MKKKSQKKGQRKNCRTMAKIEKKRGKMGKMMKKTKTKRENYERKRLKRKGKIIKEKNSKNMDGIIAQNSGEENQWKNG